MKTYLIANYTIHNPEEYLLYVQKVGPMVAAYGGKTLSADHSPTPLEGESRQVIVIVEFDTKQAAERFYHSDKYGAIKEHRLKSASGWVTLASAFAPQAATSGGLS